jgi:hypothetical protein
MGGRNREGAYQYFLRQPTSTLPLRLVPVLHRVRSDASSFFESGVGDGGLDYEVGQSVPPETGGERVVRRMSC